jgi:hypothetical protein
MQNRSCGSARRFLRVAASFNTDLKKGTVEGIKKQLGLK